MPERCGRMITTLSPRQRVVLLGIGLTGAGGVVASALGADRIAAIALLLVVTMTSVTVLVERAASGRRAAATRLVGAKVTRLTDAWGGSSSRDVLALLEGIRAGQQSNGERLEATWTRVSSSLLDIAANTDRARDAVIDALRETTPWSLAMVASLQEIKALLADLGTRVDALGVDEVHRSVAQISLILENAEERAAQEALERAEIVAAAQAHALETTRRLEKVQSDVRGVGEGLERVADSTHGTLERADSISATLGDHDRRAKEYVRSDRRTAAERALDVEALLQLNRLVEPRFSMPSLGGWAIAPRSMLAVIEHVLRERPRVVVELGSGASTVWLGYAVQRYGGHVLSIDHLESYASNTRAMIEDHGLTGVTDVRVAELREVELADGRWSWYDPAQFEDVRRIDLLVVDGPPGSTGPEARFPAVPMLRDRLVTGSIVVLDDARRRDEASILERWAEQFPEMGALRSRSESMSVFRIG